MAMQRGKLADIQTIASTAGSVYSNPASTKTYVRSIVICNTNTTSEMVTLYNVPDSGGSLGTAAATNQFFKKSLAGGSDGDGETVFIDLEYPIVLTDTNDSIQAVTTTASKVTIQLMGDKDA